MSDPTAEVIISVEIRVKVTDTGINESKEIILNEFVQAPPMKWKSTYQYTCQRVATEMEAMVEQLEIERYKAE
jgi:hypothetical protein